MKAIFALLCLLLFISCGKKDGDGEVAGNGEPGETTENTRTLADAMAVLKGNPDYSKLVELVEAHELQSVFTSEGEGKVTFFAPTNEAFESVSERALSVYEDSAEQMKYLLEKHIVDQELSTKDLQELSTLTTRSGKVVSVERANGYLWIEGKPILIKDGVSAKANVHGIGGIVGFQ